MNSKERVLTAVSLAEPDRIPKGFGANPATLSRLKSELGCSSHAELLLRLNADIVDLRDVVAPSYRGPVPRESVGSDGVKQNFWGIRTKDIETSTGPEECYCDFILEACQAVEELAAHRWPSPDWFDFTGFSDKLAEWKGFAVMATGASVWQHPTFLRGMDNLLVDFLVNPEMAEFMMDKFTDFYVEYFDRMLTAAHGQIDILRIADDLGMQDRLMIGPEQFDHFIAPRLGKLIDMSHSHRVKVMFHSCGAIVPFIDRLIALRVDILDPIQAAATGMEPELLKKQFGRRICLHGGIDTQHLLPNGHPDDVRREVRRRSEILGADGGFILAPCHVLQTDVPTENILALYDF